MPNLTVKNIPDELYVRLKEVARTHHRSMNSEIIYCVERTLGTHRVDISEHLASAASPFDVPGVKTRATTKDILSAVRNSRKG